MNDLTHLDIDGRPRMVDVSDKDVTSRQAVASGLIRVSAEAFNLLINKHLKKGDALAIAELAGIMGAKKTSEIIPLCHPLPLTGAIVEIETENPGTLRVTARVRTNGKTGVEMEALTAVSTACLTLYDMLKSVDKSIVIEEIKLLKKTGGKSGDYERDTP